MCILKCNFFNVPLSFVTALFLRILFSLILNFIYIALFLTVSNYGLNCILNELGQSLVS